MNCLRCGTQIAENALFCENCKKTVGEPLQESAYLNTQILLPVRKAQPPQAKPAKKTERKPEEEKPRGRGATAALTILCLLLLAGALFAGTLYLIGRKDNAALTEQVGALEKDKAALEEEVAALDGKTILQEARISALEARSAEQDAANAALEEKAAAQEERIAALQEAMEFINDNAAFVPNDGTYLYHTGDCSHFEKTYFQVFSVSTARSWGYQPCPYCQPAE